MFTVSSLCRRIGSVASIASLAMVAGLAVPQGALAQTRAALTRDTDNPDLAPAFFNGSFPVSTASPNTITTVPAGKRLVIDNVSYSYTSLRSADQLNAAAFYVTTQGNAQTRLYFPINPPHALNPSTGYLVQDGSFAGRTYFEAGETVLFAAGNTTFDSSRSIYVSITGHYVTP